jgi:DNA-binding NarL/FixJ family response regulator
LLERLAALVAANVVQRSEHSDGTSRYSMLEPIREFALEQLAVSGDQHALSARLAAYLCLHFETIWPQWQSDLELVWLQQCTAERDNVRTALAWAVEHDPETALRVTVAFCPFWWQRGHFTEARDWFMRGLHIGVGVSATTRAMALGYAGMFAAEQGDIVLGQHLVEEGLQFARAADANEPAGICLLVLGRIAALNHDLDQAAIRLEESATMLHAAGSRWYFGVRTELGAVLTRLRYYARAHSVLADALEAARRHGHGQSIANTLLESALLALHEQDLPNAKALLAESLMNQRALGDLYLAATTLEFCAWVASYDNQPERTARLLAAAGKIRERIGVLMYPADRTINDAYVDRATTQIGAAAWARAWTAGGALSIHDAIDEAVEALRGVGALVAAPTMLSPRELDVLRLLVEGQSDREIAEQLFISYRTVTTHVRSILNKLGVDSRTAAATYAARHHLLDTT